MCKIQKYKTQNTFLLKKLYFTMLNTFFRLNFFVYIYMLMLFRFTSNTTSFMHLTPAKLAEGGITACTLSASRARKLAFHCNLSNIFTTNHHFGLLNI